GGGGGGGGSGGKGGGGGWGVGGGARRAPAGGLPSGPQAGDGAPPRVEIADDVARGVGGARHFHVHDRLEQNRVRVHEDFLQSHRGRDLEGHVRRVHVVVGAVVERDLHVDDGVAGEDAALHAVAHALLDRRNVLARNGATQDVVDELETAAALERLHLEPGAAVLAA